MIGFLLSKSNVDNIEHILTRIESTSKGVQITRAVNNIKTGELSSQSTQVGEDVDHDGKLGAWI